MADIDFTNVKDLNDLLKKAQSKYSKELIRLGTDTEITGMQWTPLDSPKITDVLGKGIPKGRIVEVYGPESCLDGETFISYNVYDKKTNKRINHKGGSIQRLYERFHQNEETNIKQGRHLRNNNVDFYVSSINDENRIIKNKERKWQLEPY